MTSKSSSFRTVQANNLNLSSFSSTTINSSELNTSESTSTQSTVGTLDATSVNATNVDTTNLTVSLINGLPPIGAGANATFITASASADLTGERVLVGKNYETTGTDLGSTFEISLKPDLVVLGGTAPSNVPGGTRVGNLLLGDAWFRDGILTNNLLLSSNSSSYVRGTTTACLGLGYTRFQDNSTNTAVLSIGTNAIGTSGSITNNTLIVGNNTITGNIDMSLVAGGNVVSGTMATGGVLIGHGNNLQSGYNIQLGGFLSGYQHVMVGSGSGIINRGGCLFGNNNTITGFIDTGGFFSGFQNSLASGFSVNTGSFVYGRQNSLGANLTSGAIVGGYLNSNTGAINNAAMMLGYNNSCVSMSLGGFMIGRELNRLQTGDSYQLGVRQTLDFANGNGMFITAGAGASVGKKYYNASYPNRYYFGASTGVNNTDIVITTAGKINFASNTSPEFFDSCPSTTIAPTTSDHLARKASVQNCDYTPLNPTYWTDPDPTTLKEAIDRIAAAVSMNGVSPIP